MWYQYLTYSLVCYKLLRLKLRSLPNVPARMRLLKHLTAKEQPDYEDLEMLGIYLDDILDSKRARKYTPVKIWNYMEQLNDHLAVECTNWETAQYAAQP